MSTKFPYSPRSAAPNRTHPPTHATQMNANVIANTNVNVHANVNVAATVTLTTDGENLFLFSPLKGILKMKGKAKVGKSVFNIFFIHTFPHSK